MKLSRCLLVILSALLLVSCKVKIVVPEGGNVISSSGAFDCKEGKVCTIDVVDLFFDETFTAKPKNGYTFDGWKKKPKGRGFCSNPKQRKSPCRLYTSFFSQYPGLLSVLESDEVFFLQAAFKQKGATASAPRQLYSVASGLGGKIYIQKLNPNSGAEIQAYTIETNTAAPVNDIAFVGEQLYGALYTGELVKIDLGNGSMEIVGNTGASATGLQRLASYKGDLYGMDALGSFYKINLSNGFGVQMPYTMEFGMYAMTIDKSGALHGIYIDELRKFNLSSGQPLQVINLASAPGDDMAFVGNSLIALESTSGKLTQVDSNTGQTTPYAAITAAGPGRFRGITSK